MKLITIIDAFITNKHQEKQLHKFLDRIKNISDIFLITNTKLSDEIQSKVNYYFYLDEDLKFDNTYDDYEDLILWEKIDKFKVYDIYQHKQKHGLSVLKNIDLSVNFAKKLGYTHFQRIEYDTILGDKSLSIMMDNWVKIKKHDYLGIFYLNDNQTQSFQYFICEINFFNNNFPSISNESEYEKVLLNEFKNRKFKTVENLYGHFIKKIRNEKFLIKRSLVHEMGDTIWNISTSNTHLYDYEVNHKTNLYNFDNKIVLFLYSKSDIEVKRTVKLYFNDIEKKYDYHLLQENVWYLNEVEKKPDKIEIFDNNKLVFEKNIFNIVNYIEIL